MTTRPQGIFSPDTYWIVDIDGTLALKGERGPYDWSKVGEDLPNVPVIRVVRALINAGDGILLVSGRMEQCRHDTLVWLKWYGVDAFRLFMRPDGDYRPDDVLKQEIYQTQIRDRYRVAGVLDDRDKVVKAWRSLGLVCLQVAPGDF